MFYHGVYFAGSRYLIDRMVAHYDFAEYRPFGVGLYYLVTRDIRRQPYVQYRIGRRRCHEILFYGNVSGITRIFGIPDDVIQFCHHFPFSELGIGYVAYIGEYVESLGGPGPRPIEAFRGRIHIKGNEHCADESLLFRCTVIYGVYVRQRIYIESFCRRPAVVSIIS